MDFYKETPPLMLSKYDIEFFKTLLYDVNFSASPHIHSAIEFLYITKGEFEISVNETTKKAAVGDLVLVRSNAIHSIYHLSRGTGEYYVLKLTVQYLFEIFKGIGNTDCLLAFLKSKKDDRIVFEASEIPCEIKSLLDKMTEEYLFNDEMMPIAEKAYISLFIISMFRAFFSKSDGKLDRYVNKGTISLINKSVEYINLNYASAITAVECAARANLSYSYYAKLFRTIIGKSFKEYLTAIRLVKAYNILIETDIPITDVALSCGYNNHAYFTAEYKRYYGKTPTETRKTR